MINNEDEFKSNVIAVGIAGIANSALLDLRKKVYPTNPQKYFILSEPYFEQVDSLNLDIKKFLME